MNRQMRRNQERFEAKKQNNYNYTPEQIEQLLRNHNKRTILAIYATIAISLHDKNGWGKKRICRLIDESISQFDCITKKHVTVEELLQICKEFDVEIR